MKFTNTFPTKVGKLNAGIRLDKRLLKNHKWTFEEIILVFEIPLKKLKSQFNFIPFANGILKAKS